MKDMPNDEIRYCFAGLLQAREQRPKVPVLTSQVVRKTFNPSTNRRLILPCKNVPNGKFRRRAQYERRYEIALGLSQHLILISFYTPLLKPLFFNPRSSASSMAT